MADAFSIEETNKIRQSLGLPLLPVPGAGPVFKEASGSDSDSDDDPNATLDRREAQAEGNYKRALKEEQDRVARDKRKEAVRKARELAARNVKLEGKGLGEADDQEQDARAWLMGQKKRQKKIEKEREKLLKIEAELKAREEQAYTSKDLAGVRVAHELGDFEDENDHVLVLKDTTIDENEEEGDELENVDLKDDERRTERLNLKKKKPVYNPNEVAEDGESGFLKHYDEVIDGKKRKRFTLDVDGRTVEQKEAHKPTIGDQVKRQAISLDILKELPKSDYAEAKEVKIRKPKKQKKATRRKVLEDDDDVSASVAQQTKVGNEDATSGGMDIDGDTAAALTERKIASFADDEDLQASLARQRRETLKKRKKMRPEDLARQLRDEEANAMQEDEKDDQGLVIDETTFFVDNIDARQREIEEERAAAERRKAASEGAQRSPEGTLAADGDVDMGDDLDPAEMRNTGAGPDTETPADFETSAGLDSEATFNKGVGGVFGFVKDRGMWDAHAAANNDDTRASQMFKSEKRRMETEADAKARAQRLAGRENDRYVGQTQREREEMHRKENESRQYQHSQRMARFYAENYKPSFELTHKDEFGREMNEKEAFKHLSHQFHGKGSGKMKTEKRLKKIEDEKKAASKSLLDNSQMSNYSNAADATSKKRGTFGVQLGK